MKLLRTGPPGLEQPALLAADGSIRDLSAIVDDYPKFTILKGEVPLSSPRIPRLLAELRERYTSGDAPGTANNVDGLRIDWPDRWFHVRVSQTEPIVRRRGSAPPPRSRRVATVLIAGGRSVGTCRSGPRRRSRGRPTRSAGD